MTVAVKVFYEGEANGLLQFSLRSLSQPSAAAAALVHFGNGTKHYAASC